MLRLLCVITIIFSVSICRAPSHDSRIDSGIQKKKIEKKNKAINVSQCKLDIKEASKKCTKLEEDIKILSTQLDDIRQKERSSAPVIKKIYEMLARCCTTLCNIRRFSDVLSIGYVENKADFVRCSIVIKNFASYFKDVKRRLTKASVEVVDIKQQKNDLKQKKIEMMNEIFRLIDDIREKFSCINKTKSVNSIQNDVVKHIASKSESIEELDAELEAENTLGVLKNVRVASGNFVISAPVIGNIVGEFGDKINANDMSYSMSFKSHACSIVVAPIDGVIVFVGKFLNYGDIVIINNGDYRIFLYGISNVLISVGDTVNMGDCIGVMDGSISSEPIIRMELRKSGEQLDPRHWIVEGLDKKSNRNVE